VLVIVLIIRITTKKSIFHGHRPTATPASDHLFDISEDDPGKLLPEEQAQDFHHSVVQLLFLCIHMRPDLKTVVSFLTTQIKAPFKEFKQILIIL